MISNIWLGNTLFSKYRITRKDIFGITFVINYINSKLKMSNVSSSLIRNTVYKHSKTEICMLICSKKTGLSYDSLAYNYSVPFSLWRTQDVLPEN